MNCGVCKQEIATGKERIIALTQAEKDFVRKSGMTNPPDHFYYCGPCYRLLTQDRVGGAQALKGFYQAELRANGVPNAEQIAKRYYDAIMKKTTPKPVS